MNRDVLRNFINHLCAPKTAPKKLPQIKILHSASTAAFTMRSGYNSVILYYTEITLGVNNLRLNK